MAEDNKSLIEVGDLAGLSKPAEKLIDKISEAMGWVFRPKQIRRTAQAEADAEVIRARGDVLAKQIRAAGDMDLQGLLSNGRCAAWLMKRYGGNRTLKRLRSRRSRT